MEVDSGMDGIVIASIMWWECSGNVVSKMGRDRLSSLVVCVGKLWRRGAVCARPRYCWAPIRGPGKYWRRRYRVRERTAPADEGDGISQMAEGSG